MRGDSYRVNRRIRKRGCRSRTAKSCRGCEQATLPNPFQEFPSAGIAATISGFVIRFHCHPNPLECRLLSDGAAILLFLASSSQLRVAYFVQWIEQGRSGLPAKRAIFEA